jgi:hypothetical protein
MVSMQGKLFMVAALCGVVGCTEGEQMPPEQAEEAGAVTDSMNPQAAPQGAKGEVTANLVGNGPIAYGTLYPSGARGGGTANWTSTYNTTYQRYEITISGESYYFLSYATVVTPMGGSPPRCSSDSVGGRLLISCFDTAGNPTTSWISFVTSKP